MMVSPDEPAFPVPKPSWIIGLVVAIGYAILLLGLDSVLPFTPIDPLFAVPAALGGVLLYGAILWFFDLRDPRLWRDRSRFTAYVHAWADAACPKRLDDRETERLRVATRRDAGVAMAQQAGAVAAAGAAITCSDHGGPLAILVFFVAMVTVGLLLRTWLLSGDQSDDPASDTLDSQGSAEG